MLTANGLCVLAAVWIVTTGSASFWSLFARTQGLAPSSWPFAASLFLALVGLNLLLLRVLSPGRLLRPALSLLLLLAAAAGWFMDTYGVALDSEMLRNALQTNPTEARDFLGWSLLWRLAWQAGVPIALLWWVTLPERDGWRAARDWLLCSLAGVALVLAAGLPFYRSYVSFFRNQTEARYLITPANVVVGSTRMVRKSLRRPRPHVAVATDAHRLPAGHARPLLVVLVVGETARAANFSLGGYARETNPLLKQRDVFYFSDVTACGTATAQALPCLMSDLPRSDFRLADAAGRDSVLDILQRAGLDVRWIDNQSGCKGACDRVPHEAAQPYHPESCSGGECLDEALLHALDARLPQVSGDAVLVLHAMGSHGPAYHRRVPEDAVVFQPTCATQRIETCSDAQIVNAYDNTIRYTDRILAGLIDRLAAASADLDAVLLYVSDHGESLGEGGLYLHGQPWIIAPDVQKKVPLLMWFSSGAPARLALDQSCLRASLATPVSHDHVAHTLLGLHDVLASVYHPSLDLLRMCRSAHSRNFMPR